MAGMKNTTNFAKKDFEREGDYRVTFQADTKEKELRFVVDKTPPGSSYWQFG